MKNLTYLFLVFFFLSSCKKKDENLLTPNKQSYIVFKEQMFNQNGVMTFEWIHENEESKYYLNLNSNALQSITTVEPDTIFCQTPNWIQTSNLNINNDTLKIRIQNESGHEILTAIKVNQIYQCN